MLIKQDAQTIHTVVLDDCRNTIEEFVAVARYHAKVEFSQAYRDRVTASRKSLEATIASGVGVYGVNTGFGDNVRYRITEDEMVQLQENILRSHGCSVGRALSEEEARALMLMQLMSIGKGYSAVSLEMLEQIRTYLNADLYPSMPPARAPSAAYPSSPTSPSPIWARAASSITARSAPPPRCWPRRASPP